MDLPVISFNPDSRIPKIIHQTYRSKELPCKLQQSVATLIDQNPSWTHILYDDEDISRFIRDSFGTTMFKLYNRISSNYGAARADFFRYLLMYKVGGVYLDIKSRFLRPLDDVLNGSEIMVISRWSNQPGERYEGYGLKPELSHIADGEIQQWHIIAVPGHPFLRAVVTTMMRQMEEYRPWRHGTGKAGVLRLTGPIMYTLAIEPFLSSFPCTQIKNESSIGLEYSIMSGDEHHGLFHLHYTNTESPIVRPSLINWPIYEMYKIGRRLKQRLPYVSK